MPYLDRSILRTAYDDRQFGVVASKGDVAGVAFQRRNERLRSVVPNLDGAVVLDSLSDISKVLPTRLRTEVVSKYGLSD